MGTAFVFGPLSSMLRSEDRCRYRHLDEVQARFTGAAGIIGQRHGLRVCFDDLLDKPSAALCGRAHLNFTAALVISLQLGVVDRLQKFLPKPGWVVGCSLGDVARTVYAGACTFETALHLIMLTLNEVEQADQIGNNVVVMATSRNPFTAQDLVWLNAADLAVSQLSDQLLNVAGLCSGLELLKNKAQERHWKIFPLLDFPLHSRHVAHYTAKAHELIHRVSLGALASGIRVYSSVLQREIKDSEEFREEFLSSLVRPNHWKATVNDLVENQGVTSFVNIGPCRTLSKILRDMGQPVLEADELIGQKLSRFF